MTLPSLVTIEQFAARQWSPPSADAFTRLETLLLDASAKVRARSGQQFTRGVSTQQRFSTSNGRIYLPQRPVIAVTGVWGPDPITGSFSSETPLSYRVDGDVVDVHLAVLDIFAWEPYKIPPSAAYVTYEHGYDEIPDDIVAVVCSMAARAFGVDPAKTGYQQQQTGPYMVTLGVSGAQGALGMLNDEREIVDAYRQPGRSIPIRPRAVGGLW
jgi:hypothetical protein